MASGAVGYPPSPSSKRPVWAGPSTSEGRRALWLLAAGITLQPATALLVRVLSLPSALGVLGALGLLAMIVGGAFATIGIVYRGERSIFVYATLVPSLFVLLFLIGELAIGH